MTICAAGDAAWSCVSTSCPARSGRPRSSTTMSGWHSLAIPIALVPSPASATTVKPPRSRSAWRTTARTSSTSSTRRTVVAISGQRSGERAGNGAPRPVASIPVSEERFDVVLVDDAPEVRQVVAQALRLSGRFTVVAEGESGRDAIDLVARHQPALLLLDASMPGMDGLESIPGVRLASPGTRIVMLSGFDAPGLQSKAIELGADAYVEKAKPLRELAPALLALLAGAAVGEQEPPPGDEGVLDEHLERF